MLTGRRAFDGTDATETLWRVVEADPDFSALAPDTPPVLHRLVRRCLDKDRGKRLSQIGIARFEIEETVALPTATNLRQPIRRYLVGTLALGMVIGALVALTFTALRARDQRVAARPVTRLLLPVTPAEQLGGLEGRPTRPAFAISPDGQSLVFSAERANQRSLYLRRFDASDATGIPDTDGAENPFFSPDGRWVGYWAGGEIRKVPLKGGSPVRVSDAPPLYGATWGDDDRIVFSPGTDGLWEVPADGGTAVPLTRLNKERGEVSHRLPYVLPGGDAVIFTVLRHRLPRWDQTQVFVYSRRTGISKMLIDGGADARYVSTRHLLYVREGVLLAARFDPESLEVRGGPVGVVDDVMQSAYFQSRTWDIGAAQVSLSATGTLVYLPGGVFQPEERSIVSVDRTGRSETLPISPGPYATLRLSPNNQYIALSTFGRDKDLWVYTRKHATLDKLSVPGRSTAPIWTPDSERITYAAGTGGPDNLSSVRADGSGSSELLVQRDEMLVPAKWAPDGRRLFFYRIPAGVTAISSWATPSDAPRIWVHDQTSQNSATEIAGTSANAGGLDVSPDGRWIAYFSDESGRPQVYVQAYPGPAPRYQLSSSGGVSPIWSADGRELFYIQTEAPLPLEIVDVKMMAMPVSLQPSFTFGRPKVLFAGRYAMNNPARPFDVTSDGQHFLLIHSRERSPEVITQITVVQNWVEELKRLVPWN